MVTGATGFTGSHTTRALLEAGHEVRALVRDPAKLERVFGASSPLLDAAVVGDVVDPAAVERALDGCDAVVHTAALVDLRRSMADKVLTTNRGGAENVVGAAVRRGIDRIVYVSSLGAFFDPRNPSPRPLTPDTPLAPTSNAYGQSKAEAERFVRRLQDEGAPIRTTYPVGILGPDDPSMSEGNHAIVAWLGQTPLNTSSGLQILDVRDLAEMHVRLLGLPSGPRRYVAAGEFIPWSEMGGVLSSLTGTPVWAPPVPGSLLRALGRLGDVVKRVYDFDFPLTYEAMCFATMWPGADASPAEAELGMRFRPKEETLRDTLRWLCGAGHLGTKVCGRLANRTGATSAA